MEQLDGLANQLGFAADSGQFLTFTLGQEQYAVEILRVQEIKSYSPVTPIPNTPPSIKGVMNLRGAIIPVVDLRAKLALPENESKQFTAIVVVTVGTKVVGLIVDAVSDVLNIPKDDIQATPDFGGAVDARFINGIAKTGDRLVVLLDIDTVLRGDELALASAR